MRIGYMMFFRWVSICFISFFIGFEVHRLSVEESVPNFIKAVQSAQYVVDADKGNGVFLNGLRRITKEDAHEMYVFLVECGNKNSSTNIYVHVDMTSRPTVIKLKSVEDGCLAGEKEKE